MKDQIKTGQYGRFISFIDGEVKEDLLIQFIGYDDDNDLMFRMDTGNVSKLTISKDCFPIHEWNSGTKDNPIKRKSIVDMN